MKKSIEYLAGLFDGEGSFSIQVGLRGRNPERPGIYFNPALQLNLYYGTNVLDAFVETFGGKIYPYQRDGKPRGARWHLGGIAAQLVAARVLEPHLVIKRDIARRFIGALELFPNRGGACQKHGERAWSVERALVVAEIALTLNPPRSRKTNKTADYVETMRKLLPSDQQTQKPREPPLGIAGRGLARLDHAKPI